MPDTAQPKLTLDAASGEGADWELAILINGKEIKRQTINATGEPWKTQSLDLAPWRGQTIAIQLENHPNGWAWEFSYWSNLKITP